MGTKNKKPVVKTPVKKYQVELINLLIRRSPEVPPNRTNQPCKCKSTDLGCTHFGA